MDDEVAQAPEPNSSPPLDSEPQAANDDLLRNSQQRQEADKLLREIQEEHHGATMPLLLKTQHMYRSCDRSSQG